MSTGYGAVDVRGGTGQHLLVLSQAGVARFKCPERLEVVAELPVTKVGKLDKKALRDMLAAAGPAVTGRNLP